MTNSIENNLNKENISKIFKKEVNNFYSHFLNNYKKDVIKTNNIFKILDKYYNKMAKNYNHVQIDILLNINDFVINESFKKPFLSKYEFINIVNASSEFILNTDYFYNDLANQYKKT